MSSKALDNVYKLRDIVNVKEPAFGARVDGSTDDTAAVALALTTGAGATVFIGEGTCILSGIGIPSDTTLEGAGFGTILKQKDNSTVDLIKLADATTTVRAKVKNLQIDGNKANQTLALDGIDFDNTGAASGHIGRHEIDYVYVRDCKGDGVKVGALARETRASRIWIYNCDDNGLELACADSQFSDIIVGQSGADGVRISGSALMLSNIKSWYSGRLTSGSAGFLFRNAENVIGTGLYTQENSGHGFSFFGQSGPMKGLNLNCISDGDNTALGTFHAMNMNNVDGAIINLKVAKYAAALGTVVDGVSISATSKNCNINVTTDSASISGRPVSGGGIGNNNIRINGRELHFQRLVDDFTGDAVADQWGSQIGSHGSVAAPAINSQIGGVVRLVTGADAAGTMATNGVQLQSELNWAANQHGLSIEFRLKVNNITDVAIFAGFTDQIAALEMPFTLGAGDALTSNATDAVGVLFDTGADTDNWWMVGVANNVDATKQNAGVAPAAGTFETWRIVLANNGQATFFRNGTLVGSSMNGAVTASGALTPVVAAFSRGASSRAIDVDVIKVEQLRPS